MPKLTEETLKQIQKPGLSISIISSEPSRLSAPSEALVTKEARTPKQTLTVDKTPKLPSQFVETKQVLPRANKILTSAHFVTSTPECRGNSWGNSTAPRSVLESKRNSEPISFAVQGPSIFQDLKTTRVSSTSDGRITQQELAKNRLPNTPVNFEGQFKNMVGHQNSMVSPPLPETRQPRGLQHAAEFRQTNTKVTPNRPIEPKQMSNSRQLNSRQSVSPDSTMCLVPYKPPEPNTTAKHKMPNMVVLNNKGNAGVAKAAGRMTPQTKMLNQVAYETVSVEQKMMSGFDISPENIVNPNMPSQRGGNKRVQVTSTTPATKKKCIGGRVLTSLDPTSRVQSPPETCNVSSDEGSPQKKVINVKTGLTITPVAPVQASIPSSSGVRKTAAKNATNSKNMPLITVCENCKQVSVDLRKCQSCGHIFTSPAKVFRLASTTAPANVVITESVTTEKKITYHSQGQNIKIQQKVLRFQTPQVIQVSPRGKGRGRGRRKLAEPVVYTLSSDDEETAQVAYNVEHGDPYNNDFPMESEGSKSEHSSTSDICHDENPEFDDPEYPGVTDINSPTNHHDDEEQTDHVYVRQPHNQQLNSSVDEELEDEEEELPEDEEEEEFLQAVDVKAVALRMEQSPLRCRSIRIGSYKVHPKDDQQVLKIILQVDGITFEAPLVTDPSRWGKITLRQNDIVKITAHFGRCLPILFIYTTVIFGISLRNFLKMSDGDSRNFDPASSDEKVTKLTFLVDCSISDDQRRFLRHVFPGEKKIEEIDQKTANEILVKSTPNQSAAIKISSDTVYSNNSLTASTGEIIQSISLPAQISVTKVTVPPPVPQPIVKLITYPPPPQTGGITVTSEDLACLNEGEFLNDAILDFYLKYVFNEKLSPEQRDRTHIFSSFFYPRLTHNGKSEEKTVQMRRHNQVKTWTRHIDIFSKDFIVIPVNINVHWFLAIVCYPGLVPDAPKGDKKPKDAPDEEEEQKVSIKELDSNEENSSPEESPVNDNIQSPYQVEEPPDSDETSEVQEPAAPTSQQDGKVKKNVPCICIFDSLTGPNRWRVAAHLRDYLEMEWKMKKGTRKIFDRNTMQGFVMKCPQQTNYSDCGVYVLQYVESFFENPPSHFASPMPDLSTWFSEQRVSKKRQQLKDLILSIQKKQQQAGQLRRPNHLNDHHTATPSDR